MYWITVTLSTHPALYNTRFYSTQCTRLYPGTVFIIVVIHLMGDSVFLYIEKYCTRVHPRNPHILNGIDEIGESTLSEIVRYKVFSIS